MLIELIMIEIYDLVVDLRVFGHQSAVLLAIPLVDCNLVRSSKLLRLLDTRSISYDKKIIIFMRLTIISVPDESSEFSFHITSVMHLLFVFFLEKS